MTTTTRIAAAEAELLMLAGREQCDLDGRRDGRPAYPGHRMSAVTDDLRMLPQRAADWIDTHGWVQGTEQNADGAVCLTGALRFCEPRPGDWLIAREVFRQRKHAEGWNDTKGRTQAEVQDYLRSVEIDDAELAKTFGPQWESIVALVRTAATITPQQGNELDAAWDAAGDAARAAAWDAAWAAAGATAWAAARVAAGVAARVAAGVAAWDAAGVAAWALVVRDLIGQHGFTAEHYQLLTAPWAAVMGKVHPND
jgi:hypothetical protein